MMAMSQTIFLFADTASDIGLDGMGGGWVAVCDGVIAYGNADSREAPDAARRILLDRAFDFATRRFPDADEILVTGPKDDVIRLPWGEALGDDALLSADRTGIGAYCAAKDVRLSVRWLPGHLPGKAADVFALGVARVLATQARRCVELWGEIVHEAGWRSQLVSLFGGPAFNHGIEGRGMTHAQVADFVGIGIAEVGGFVRPGWLSLTPDDRITYATAIRLRDGLEADGTVSWDEDDFGEAHLDLLSEPACATVCVDHAANRRGMGVGIALRHGPVVKAWAKRYDPAAEDVRADGLRAALQAVAFRLQDLEGSRVVDVVTGDSWLAKILCGNDDERPAVIQAAGLLRETARGLGITIRARHIHLPFWRPRLIGGLQGLSRASCLLAHSGVAGGSACHEAAGVLGGDGLLALCERQAADIRSALPLQADLIRTLFTDCAVEATLREFFERLVADTISAYRGVVVDLHPFLPGQMGGGVSVLTPIGPRPLGKHFPLPSQIADRWRGWHSRFERVRARNPAVQLRERLLEIDRTVDLSRWDMRRYRSVMRWMEGGQAHSPFDLPSSTRIRIESEIRALAEECGGWPWSEPGSPNARLRPRSRRPVATVARIGRAQLPEFAA
jgi:hypothetical protein